MTAIEKRSTGIESGNKDDVIVRLVRHNFANPNQTDQTLGCFVDRTTSMNANSDQLKHFIAFRYTTLRRKTFEGRPVAQEFAWLAGQITGKHGWTISYKPGEWLDKNQVGLRSSGMVRHYIAANNTKVLISADLLDDNGKLDALWETLTRIEESQIDLGEPFEDEGVEDTDLYTWSREIVNALWHHPRHISDTPVPCPECGKGYRSRGALCSHVRGHGIPAWSGPAVVGRIGTGLDDCISVAG